MCTPRQTGKWLLEIEVRVRLIVKAPVMQAWRLFRDHNHWLGGWPVYSSNNWKMIPGSHKVDLVAKETSL